jgi:hypothetical protein
VRNILDRSVKLTAQERLMVLYDRRSPLSSLLAEAYQRQRTVLPPQLDLISTFLFSSHEI